MSSEWDNKNDERFQLAMELIQEGLFDWDLVSNDIYYSDSWKKMLGYRPEELENNFSVWEKLTKDEDVDRAWVMHRELVERKRDLFDLEYKMQHKDGHWVDILSRSKAIFDANGKAVRIIGTHIDISKRKFYEKKIRRQKEEIERYLDLAGVLFVVLDTKGHVILINRKACDTLEYKREEIIGKDWIQNCIPERTRPEVRYITNRIFQGDINPVEYHENPVLTQSGEERIIAWHNNIIKDENGKITGHLSSGEDITDKRKVANILQKSQKMESIGVLAGGIAHDFNNILNPVIGAAELLIQDLSSDPQKKDLANLIVEAGQRGSNLVKQILAFSRNSEDKFEPVQLQKVVNDAVHLCRASIPSNIIIEKRISHDSHPVMGNSTQLHQVMMNLITNAYQAVSSSNGKVEVKLQQIQVKPDNDEHLDPGDYVQIIVSDNGNGIDPKILDSIFEPYFTTKEKTKGTGLGLAVVHGIVTSHNGEIKVRSNLLQGTTFKLFLPVCEEEVFEKLNKKKTNTHINPSSIMVIDDEKATAMILKEILKRLGHTVEFFTKSKEALKAFEANPSKYDLIITDLTMPELTGEQLALKILAKLPTFPIIVCTGYLDGPNQDFLKESGVKGVLIKPFTIDRVTQMVWVALSKK